MRAITFVNLNTLQMIWLVVCCCDKIVILYTGLLTMLFIGFNGGGLFTPAF